MQELAPSLLSLVAFPGRKLGLEGQDVKKEKHAKTILTAIIVLLSASSIAQADFLIASNTPVNPDGPYTKLVSSLRKNPVSLDDSDSAAQVKSRKSKKTSAYQSPLETPKGGEFSQWADGFFHKDVSPY
jgi:hypothetical protein